MNWNDKKAVETYIREIAEKESRRRFGIFRHLFGGDSLVERALRDSTLNNILVGTVTADEARAFLEQEHDK